MENNTTTEPETTSNISPESSGLNAEDETLGKSDQNPDQSQLGSDDLSSNVENEDDSTKESNQSIVSPVLSEDLRSKVLQVKVNLQGKSASLDQFVDEQWINDNIDSDIAKMLTEGDTISIGNENAFSSDGYVENYYVSRKFQNTYPPPNSKEAKYFIEPLINDSHKEQVVIVTCDSGTGKSTILTSLARQLRDLYHEQTEKCLWVLRVDLSEHYQQMQRVNFGRCDAHNDRPKAIDFLSKIEIPGDSEESANVRFQRILLKESLFGKTKLNIVLFFDGYHDIGSFLFDNDLKKVVYRFLRALERTSVHQMFIAIKPKDQERLSCKIYGSWFYSLCPLSKDEQIEFLDRYWKWYLKFDKGQNRSRTYHEILDKLGENKVENEEMTTNLKQIFTKYPHDKIEKVDELKQDIDSLDFKGIALKLIEDFTKAFGEGNKDFTIIPLHLEVMTMSIFRQNFQMPNKLFNLFDEFVKVKIQQFVKQKSNDNSKEALITSGFNLCQFYEQLHTQISAKLLLGEEFHLNRKFMRDSKLNIAEDAKTLEKDLIEIGLLSRNDDRIQFVHRTYAEYFLSRYAINNWNESQVQRILVERVFRQDIFKMTRQFINDQLKINKHLCTQLTSSMDEIMANHLARNNLASSTFDRICNEGLTEIFDYLFNSIRSDILKEYGLTITNEAIRNNNVDIFEQLLTKSLEVSPEILKNHILKSPPSIWSEDYLLSRMVFENNQKMIETLLNFLHKHRAQLGEGCLEEIIMPEDDESILHKLISNQKSTETVKFLLNLEHFEKDTLKKLILASTAKRISFVFMQQTAFHKAIHLGHTENVIPLFQVIEKYPDLMREIALKTDYFGATALTHLIKHRNKVFDLKLKKKIVNALLKAILNGRDPNDQPAVEELMEFIIISAWATPFGKSVKQFSLYFIKELLDLLDDDLKFLRKLIRTKRQKIDSLGTVGDQSRLLHKAICHHNHERVREILKDAHDRNFMRPLMLAVPSNAFGAPLHNVVTENDIEILKQLLESIKTLSPRILTEIVLKVDTKGKGTVLSVASQSNHHEIVRELLNFVKTYLPHEVFEQFLVKVQHMYPYELIIGSAYSKKHNETVKLIFESTLDHPKLLVKMMETIGGAHETFKWTRENGYIELEEKIVQSIFESDLDTQTKLFFAAETEHVNRFEELLKSVPGGTQALIDIFKYTNDGIKTLLNQSKGKTAFILLNWVKENCKNESDSTLRDLVLETDSKKILEIEFLDWIKEHVESKWPGTMKKIFAKRCLNDGMLISALANDNSAIKSPAMDFLNWVKANFEEALSDVVLAVDRMDYDIFRMVILNFHHYFPSVDFLLDLLKDHPNILRTMLLSQFTHGSFYKYDMEEEKAKEFDRISDRLKEQYRIIGQSLLKSETNVNDFKTEELEVLANYFENDLEQMEKKQEIVEKIQIILKEREIAKKNMFA